MYICKCCVNLRIILVQALLCLQKWKQNNREILKLVFETFLVEKCSFNRTKKIQFKKYFRIRIIKTNKYNYMYLQPSKHVPKLLYQHQLANTISLLLLRYTELIFAFTFCILWISPFLKDLGCFDFHLRCLVNISLSLIRKHAGYLQDFNNLFMISYSVITV